jgi:hypothetical protein
MWSGVVWAVFNLFQLFTLFLALCACHLTVLYYDEPTGEFSDDYGETTI